MVDSKKGVVRSLIWRMLLSGLLLGLVIVVSACTSLTQSMTHDTAETSSHEMNQMDEEAVTAGDLTIGAMMARATIVEDGNSAAYLLITNNGQQEERLLEASTPAAGTVQLHESLDDNGVMRMEHRPDGFVIPAGGSLQLEPGGKHVMLMNLAEPLAPGETISITLSFVNQDPVTVAVPVMEIGTGMDHSR
ncbi:MAG: copper chaperone PCu(A)C [Chloroflexota bacterium]